MTRTTNEQMTDLIFLMRRMGLDRDRILDIAACMNTAEELYHFLTLLSEKNYEMTPDEVYEAMVDTVIAFQGTPM